MSQGSAPVFRPSPETLRAVSRLERHVEWHRGFWLAYVFTISPPQAHILQERVGEKLREQGREQRVLRPETPEALQEILAEVLAGPNAGCTWVEAVRPEGSVPDPDGWARAWVRFILRANERRELIRGRLDGGLLLVAHPEAKPHIRDAGPDLWSVRNFVFVLPPNEARETMAEGERSLPTSFTDAVLLDSDLRRLPTALRGQDALARAWIQQKIAARLHAAGRYEEAVSTWREAVALHRSRAEAADAPGAALLDAAVALRGLGDALNAIERYDEAESAYSEAISIMEDGYGSREHAEISGTLHALGNVLAALRRDDEATRAFSESVAIGRKVHGSEAHPEVRAALEDFANALNRQGRTHYQPSVAAEERPGVEEIVDELARVIWDADEARWLALRAGYPPAVLPSFNTPLVFWTQVVQNIVNGMSPGLDSLLAEVAEIYPGNAVFQRYRLRTR